MPPVIKVGLLSLAAAAHWVAFTPPVPPPSKEDQINKSTLFERTGPRARSRITQLLTAACLMIECAVTIALNFSNVPFLRISLDFCPAPSPSVTKLSHLSTVRIMGLIMIYASVAMRVWCYKTLGRLYTYEITIRPGHRLITSGPYAYVRHPSYTAIVFMITGTAIVCLGPGSYIDECGIMYTAARWFIRAWVFFLVYWVVSFLRRGGIEDEGLKKVFGDSWDQYRRAVPCRFVPGII